MAFDKNKSAKCCLTCANWAGPRSIGGGWAKTEHPDTRGKCNAGVFSGVTQGHRACDGTSCSKYQLWSALQ